MRHRVPSHFNWSLPIRGLCYLKYSDFWRQQILNDGHNEKYGTASNKCGLSCGNDFINCCSLQPPSLEVHTALLSAICSILRIHPTPPPPLPSVNQPHGRFSLYSTTPIHLVSIIPHIFQTGNPVRGKMANSVMLWLTSGSTNSQLIYPIHLIVTLTEGLYRGRNVWLQNELNTLYKQTFNIFLTELLDAHFLKQSAGH